VSLEEGVSVVVSSSWAALISLATDELRALVPKQHLNRPPMDHAPSTKKGQYQMRKASKQDIPDRERRETRVK
jgi:hypothetical protein